MIFHLLLLFFTKACHLLRVLTKEHFGSNYVNIKEILCILIFLIYVSSRSLIFQEQQTEVSPTSVCIQIAYKQ